MPIDGLVERPTGQHELDLADGRARLLGRGGSVERQEVPLTVALFDGTITAVAGGLVPTVSVKAWVAVPECASVALMVIGYVPCVPDAGVPARVPPAVRLTPEGRVPVSVNVIGVSPIAVTVNVLAVVAVKVAAAADVMEGPVAVTVRVKAWVAVLECASVAVMVIG